MTGHIFLRRRAALVLVAAYFLGAPAVAGDPIAQIIISAAQPVAGSAKTTGAPAVPAERFNREPAGSQAFQSALQILVAGDSAAAFTTAAAAITDPVERQTIEWAAIHNGADGLDADTIAKFAADAPEFDFSSVYQARIETALLKGAPDKAKIIRLLGGQMPRTLDARIALAQAYVADGQMARAARIARYIWVNEYLNQDDETKVLSALGALLTQKDHWDRAVHLLMNDRATSAERMLKFLLPAQQTLAMASIAVSLQTSAISSLFDKVDPAFRDDPLYHFSKGQWLRDTGDLAGAIAELAQVSGNVPDAAAFWYERRLIVRRALVAGDAKLAYKAAAQYVDGPEGRVVDAQFHAGWVALSFLNEPAIAKSHFEKMAALSTLPDTITQASYWLGLAEKALGDTKAAEANFRKAARYGTLYYGQLAREALGEKAVSLRALPDWRARQTSFEALPVVRAARLLLANRQNSLAEQLVRRLGYSISDPGDFVLAARLAQDVGANNVAILIAELADQKGYALDLFHFPKDGIPKDAKLAQVDNAAVYAIARQESRFDPEAISRSGARGLMQLMPSTAKDVATRAGLAYSNERLTRDPNYNLLLGSTYLASQLQRFDNSLVLAAAAYNAGGGNVNTWLKSFGDPRLDTVDAVSWVEMIPFVETRNYVQKVLANYLVYRARLGDRSLTMHQVLRRIPS